MDRQSAEVIFTSGLKLHKDGASQMKRLVKVSIGLQALVGTGSLLQLMVRKQKTSIIFMPTNVAYGPVYLFIYLFCLFST